MSASWYQNLCQIYMNDKLQHKKEKDINKSWKRAYSSPLSRYCLIWTRKQHDNSAVLLHHSCCSEQKSQQIETLHMLPMNLKWFRKKYQRRSLQVSISGTWSPSYNSPRLLKVALRRLVTTRCNQAPATAHAFRRRMNQTLAKNRIAPRPETSVSG